MIHSPYSARVCTHYSMEDIAKQLQTDVSSGVLQAIWQLNIKNSNKQLHLPQGVFAVCGASDALPSFGHPIVPELIIQGEVNYLKKDNRRSVEVYFDARPFTTMNRDGNVTVTNESEFEIVAMRAALQRFTLKNTMGDLLSLGNFPMLVFSRWLSQAIRQKFGITNPIDAQRLSVICSVYYYCLFMDIKQTGDTMANFPEGEKVKMASAISRATFTSAEDAFAIIDELPMMGNLEGLVKCIAEKGNNIRFQGLKVGVITQLIGGSWFGFNSREIVDVALEHPPTLFSLLYAAVKSKTYSKTPLATVAQDLIKGDNAQSWTRSLGSLPEVMWEVKAHN